MSPLLPRIQLWSLFCRPQSFWPVAQERTLLSTLRKRLLIWFIERLYGKAGFFFSGDVLTCICVLEDVVLQDLRSHISAVFDGLDEIASVDKNFGNFQLFFIDVRVC